MAISEIDKTNILEFYHIQGVTWNFEGHLFFNIFGLLQDIEVKFYIETLGF